MTVAKLKSFKELKEQYSGLQLARERFDEGYIQNLQGTASVINVFLEDCYFKLKNDERLRFTGKKKLFAYIDFGHEFLHLVQSFMAPSTKPEPAPSKVEPSAYPTRNPNYKEKSTILQFLNALGWSTSQPVTAGLHETKNMPLPTYSDPSVLQHIARMQS